MMPVINPREDDGEGILGEGAWRLTADIKGVESGVLSWDPQPLGHCTITWAMKSFLSPLNLCVSVCTCVCTCVCLVCARVLVCVCVCVYCASA